MVRSTLLAALVLLAACFGRSRASDPLTAANTPRDVIIEVTNASYSEATLHVYKGGERSRLGIVSALDEATFTIGWENTLDMQINIDLLAGPSCLTRRLPVDPGDIIELTIENNLYRDMDCIRVTGP